MSTKHNVKKNRSKSNYPSRLADRRESSATVRMPFIDRNGRRHDTAEMLHRVGG